MARILSRREHIHDLSWANRHHWLQEHAIYHRENGRGNAHRQGKRQYRYASKSRCLEKLPDSKLEILHHTDPSLFSLRCSPLWLWIQELCVGGIIVCVDKPCSLSHRDAVRTGPAVVVQRGEFVIAGRRDPFENLIRCGFANELLTREPENLTHVGIGFG